MSDSQVLVVMSTFPDVASAREVAGRLLDERLATCVSLMPGVESHFDWQGERQQSTEVAVLIKTTQAAYPDLEERLSRLHPYEVPEILGFPAERGLEAYLGWVRGGCQS
jgi:periplasmic divalent cation tolerance protein